MKKFLLALLVLAVIIYVGGTAITATQTQQAIDEFYAEQQAELESLFGDVDMLAVEWHERGWWNSSLTVTLQPATVDFEQTLVSEVKLRHGLARSTVTAEHWLRGGDDDLHAHIFGSEPIRSEGHVGVGGLALTTTTPAVEEQFAGVLDVKLAPLVMRLAVQDDDQQLTLELPYLQWEEQLQEEHIRLGADGQPQTEYVDGTFELNLRELTLESGSRSRDQQLALQEFNGALQSLEVVMSDETTTLVDTEWRSRGEVHNGQYDQHLTLKLGELSSIFGRGAAELDLSLTGLPLAELQAWQASGMGAEFTASDDALELLEQTLSAWYANEPELQVHNLTLTEAELGKLVMNGRAWFNETMAEAEAGALFADSARFLSHVDLEFDITEAPMMLRATLMPITTDELPWQVRLEGEHLYLNEERLSEDELVEDMP